MTISRTIHVHFICTGNIYRSRLAEAYLRSKNLPYLTVSSSGTRASEQHKGPTLWMALRLLYRNNLLPFMTNAWVQTTPDQLVKADLVVFFGKNNLKYCQQRFPIPKKYEVWELPDFDDRDLNGKPLDMKRETECIALSEKIFSKIKEKVDKLINTYKLDAGSKKYVLIASGPRNQD